MAIQAIQAATAAGLDQDTRLIAFEGRAGRRAVSGTGGGVNLWEQDTNFTHNFGLETTGELRTGQKALSLKPFRVHHLMLIEEHMHIFDHAAFYRADAVIIDQIAGCDKNFGLAKVKFRASVSY